MLGSVPPLSFPAIEVDLIWHEVEKATHCSPKFAAGSTLNATDC